MRCCSFEPVLEAALRRRRADGRCRARQRRSVRSAHPRAARPAGPDRRARSTTARCSPAARSAARTCEGDDRVQDPYSPALPAAGGRRLPRPAAPRRAGAGARGECGDRQPAGVRRATRRLHLRRQLPRRAGGAGLPTRWRVAIAEVGAIAERRIAMLIDAGVSRLPPFLTADAGLNSGFMIAHVTAASLASENKSLAHPASVDSLPTSANQEDHVSMATFAARRLQPMIANTAHILGIELLAAAQGIEFLRPLQQLARARAGARAAARAVPARANATATSRPTSSAPPRCVARRLAVARVPHAAGLAGAVDSGLTQIPTSSEQEPHEATTFAARTRRRRAVATVRAGPGNQGRDRHLGLDRLRAADAGQGGGPLQEARPRRRRSRRSRRRTATSRSPRATSSARPPRSRPGSSGTPTASRRRRSSSSTRATAPTAWWCKPSIAKIADLKGKTVAASAPGTAPYFTLAWMLKKNGLSVKDVKVVNLEPQAAANAIDRRHRRHRRRR